MKKFFMCAVAIAATMSLTSCLSEEEVNLEKGNMGTISVNIEADNTLVTRATATASTWYAFVKKGETAKFGTADTKALIGTDGEGSLAKTPMAYGSDYTVKVSNYPSMTTALSENDGFGAPYFEGTKTPVTVNAGAPTTVDINCGKAQNAKLVLDYSDFSGASLNSVTVSATGDRQVKFQKADATAEPAISESRNLPAYFEPETVSYVVKYQLDGGEEKTYPLEGTATIELAAGTLNKLIFKTNANGTISIGTITYDDKFGEGKSKTITISAEDGSVLTVEEGVVAAEE